MAIFLSWWSNYYIRIYFVRAHVRMKLVVGWYSRIGCGVTLRGWENNDWKSFSIEPVAIVWRLIFSLDLFLSLSVVLNMLITIAWIIWYSPSRQLKAWRNLCQRWTIVSSKEERELPPVSGGLLVLRVTGWLIFKDWEQCCLRTFNKSTVELRTDMLLFWTHYRHKKSIKMIYCICQGIGIAGLDFTHFSHVSNMIPCLAYLRFVRGVLLVNSIWMESDWERGLKIILGKSRQKWVSRRHIRRINSDSAKRLQQWKCSQC